MPSSKKSGKICENLLKKFAARVDPPGLEFSLSPQKPASSRGFPSITFTIDAASKLVFHRK